MRTSCTSRIAAAGATLFAFAAASAQADFTSYTIEKLVFEGDPAPGGGTLIQMVGELDLDEDGRITFVCWAAEGLSLPVQSVYSFENGVLAAEVSEGDAAPETGGLLFSDLGRPRIAAPGILGYLGLYPEGLGTSWSGFLRDGATDSAMALPGTFAPGGGTISKVLYIHTATSAPSVAFGAEVDTGGASPLAAHFVHETTGLREIHREGQPAPAGVGGTFSGVKTWWVPALTADGTAAFYADVTGGSVASGIFEASPAGTVTPVLLEGAAVTAPGGGTFTEFAQLVGGNRDGDLVIYAAALRPPAIYDFWGVYALEGGAQREVIYRGDPVPGTNPPRFHLGLAGSGPPEINRAGVVAFAATVTDEHENVSERALLVDDNGDLRLVAKEGDPVPGIPGENFTDFNDVRIAENGSVAFYGYTTTGTGMFLATPPPPVPALPPLGLALFALTAIASGAWTLRGVRERSASH